MKKNKTIVSIESPVAQQNLSTFDEIKEKIICVEICELMTGKVLVSQLVPSTLDLSFLGTGEYILSLKMKSGEISRKISVQQLGHYDVVRA